MVRGDDAGEGDARSGARRVGMSPVKVREIIDALEVSENEFRFQASRLAQQSEPETESEREHLRDLREGYANAARYAAILRRYQQGRLERERQIPNEDSGSTVDAAGRPAAFTEDEGR